MLSCHVPNTMMKTILTAALLFTCVGCANSTFITRPVQDEPSLFVGLTKYNDSGKLEEVQHNHPMEWSEADLHAILTRLLVQKKGGIMDPLTQPRPVFSPDDILLLTPALRESFSVAGPSDWVVFALWGSSPKSQALEVTSGGMFFEDQSLHIILANHRERVSSEKEGIKGVRSNPFRSLRDIKKGKLMFEPTRYVIDSRDNWISGGYDSPASEIILDLKAILANNRLSIPTDQKVSRSSESSGAHSPPSPSADSEVGELKQEISNLKEELSRLQRQINQQAEERFRQTDPKRHPSSP